MKPVQQHSLLIKINMKLNGNADME